MVRRALLLLQADEIDPEAGGAPCSRVDGDGAKEEAQLLELLADSSCRRCSGTCWGDECI